jgi:exopolysaccharide biosynthesis predicted pyruvyltransferase EpsI
MDHAALIARYAGQLREAFAPLASQGHPAALVDFPDSSNCGDHAVWLGEKALLAELGAPVAYECSAQSYNRDEMAAKIGDGVVFVHGGGSFGHRYALDHEFRLQVMQDFPRNRIVVFPLEVTAHDNAFLESSRAVLGNHKDIALFARSRGTEMLLRGYFGDTAKIVLAPDMAFLLGTQARLAEPSFDVVWIARTDQSRANDQSEVATRLSSQPAEKWSLPPFPDGIEMNLVIKQRPTAVMLTDWFALFFESDQHRTAMAALDFDSRARIYFSRALYMLSLGRAVVTDRLHAHLFCLMLGLPHILLNDETGKNWNFYESWSRESGLCRLAGNATEAWTLARNAAVKLKDAKDKPLEAWRW